MLHLSNLKVTYRASVPHCCRKQPVLREKKPHPQREQTRKQVQYCSSLLDHRQPMISTTSSTAEMVTQDKLQKNDGIIEGKYFL